VIFYIDWVQKIRWILSVKICDNICQCMQPQQHHPISVIVKMPSGKWNDAKKTNRQVNHSKRDTSKYEPKHWNSNRQCVEFIIVFHSVAVSQLSGSGFFPYGNTFYSWGSLSWVYCTNGLTVYEFLLYPSVQNRKALVKRFLTSTINPCLSE
jgi:hypothetical protein